VESVLGHGHQDTGSIPVWGKALFMATLSAVSDPGVQYRKPAHRATFSIGHVGASRKSHNDALWETLSLTQ